MLAARYRHHGFTLPEMLMVIAITSIIVVVLFAILMTSMRVWHRVSSQQQAFPPAYLVMSRISRELKNAYHVNIVDDGATLIFRTPLQTTRTISGETVTLNSLDINGNFQVGTEVMYYRSDDTGEYGVEGNVLWREETVGEDEPVLRRIAGNVTNMEFVEESETGGGRVYTVYSSTVTVQGEEGAQQFQSTFDGAIGFRNQTTSN